MNYSIPTGFNEKRLSPPIHNKNRKREIQSGDSDTRLRQLEAQVEQLTLQNVKLQRTNRLLKIDTDNLIEQRTSPLEKTIEELTIVNVKLQRLSRLLQLELDEKTKELNEFKQNQILQMKSVGPEYEFLVQNINLLQRQIAGRPICDDTCCFTMKPIDQSTMVMTLPSTNNDEITENEAIEAQHICRPIIHSNISQGSYAIELEKKIYHLNQAIEELYEEKDQMFRQQSLKDNDFETLKKELRIKDEIVTQLEQDFMGLEDQIEHLQKVLQDQSYTNNDDNTCSLITSPPITQSDPKRQSYMLMESKRRSLAIKDTELLEQMLRGDLEIGFQHKQNPKTLSSLKYSNYTEEDAERKSSIESIIEEDDDITFNNKSSSLSSLSSSSSIVTSNTLSLNTNYIDQKETEEEEEIEGINNTSCNNGIPCTFPSKNHLISSSSLLNNNTDNNLNNNNCNSKKPKYGPFLLFAGMAINLGFASCLGITDDWTEFNDEVVVNTRPKMAWDDEESDDNDNQVKESWDESEEEEEEKQVQPVKKTETVTKAPAKKNLTLKQKIAEKEALLKEQKAKKIALANRFLEGETEEEKFERAQKEAGIKKEESDDIQVEEVSKKAPSKPVESIKPRTRADFEEFKQLLTDMILQTKGNSAYASFIEQLAKDLSAPMKDMDVRKAASSLTALANDKQRQQKEALKHSKKTKGKVQPAKAAPAPTREYSSTYDDFDDFM
ncbi:translation initiation factor eIF3 subunit-domain-containing protein [Cokeromyces recurvatus]|uniref:translation initiation factor eIF3 subunit-domain-containing protein n=1 Tax=Cokeromyces recurvatus TaxID=90255 RepID=UPI00221F3A87|nr:translation initiation factor eIF3 subunit-domain-containing protein [Cokeromyces recurvatus]KAI7907603.1 translation initiation factor eIF3 subunit-domain-containing protein [Cokeromyces recurvatus]